MRVGPFWVLATFACGLMGPRALLWPAPGPRLGSVAAGEGRVEDIHVKLCGDAAWGTVHGSSPSLSGYYPSRFWYCRIVRRQIPELAKVDGPLPRRFFGRGAKGEEPIKGVFVLFRSRPCGLDLSSGHIPPFSAKFSISHAVGAVAPLGVRLAPIGRGGLFDMEMPYLIF